MDKKDQGDIVEGREVVPNPQNRQKIYEGHWGNDMYNGWGRMVRRSGICYEGEFLNNRCHGRGKMTWPEQDQNPDANTTPEKYLVKHFDGLFEKNQRIDGIMVFKNGDVYKGKF